uniref:Uncharacterized protein n=1 Tax=Timema tahoe TaxID=61484 RepID=A0A7R9NU30_9NEOP|nr:unnamed protein product [Timema tahoe]
MISSIALCGCLFATRDAGIRLCSILEVLYVFLVLHPSARAENLHKQNVHTRAHWLGGPVRRRSRVPVDTASDLLRSVIYDLVVEVPSYSSFKVSRNYVRLQAQGDSRDLESKQNIVLDEKYLKMANGKSFLLGLGSSLCVDEHVVCSRCCPKYTPEYFVLHNLELVQDLWRRIAPRFTGKREKENNQPRTVIREIFVLLPGTYEYCATTHPSLETTTAAIQRLHWHNDLTGTTTSWLRQHSCHPTTRIVRGNQMGKSTAHRAFNVPLSLGHQVRVTEIQ